MLGRGVCVANPVVIGDATLYLGDAREILPILERVDLCLTDPPYGNAGLWQGGATGTKSHWQLAGGGANCEWDDLPIDFIDLVVASARDCIIWGGQYYALPCRRGWLAWDKTPREFTSGAIELAWSTLDQPTRAFTYPRAFLGKIHPSEKPLPLMIWCLGFVPAAESVIDPTMGSGTSGVAALRAGKRFVGIEKNPHYFDLACERIENAQRQGKMFDEPKPAKPEQLTL